MALPRRLYPKEFKINAVHLVQLKADVLVMSPMNLALDAKLSTPGFMRPAPVFCPEPPITPEKSLLRRPKLHD